MATFQVKCTKVTTFVVDADNEVEALDMANAEGTEALGAEYCQDCEWEIVQG
jgi:hypothetical protein